MADVLGIEEAPDSVGLVAIVLKPMGSHKCEVLKINFAVAATRFVKVV
jgi:hypothetical protein